MYDTAGSVSHVISGARRRHSWAKGNPLISRAAPIPIVAATWGAVAALCRGSPRIQALAPDETIAFWPATRIGSARSRWLDLAAESNESYSGPSAEFVPRLVAVRNTPARRSRADRRRRHPAALDHECGRLQCPAAGCGRGEPRRELVARWHAHRLRAPSRIDTSFVRAKWQLLLAHDDPITFHAA